MERRNVRKKKRGKKRMRNKLNVMIVEDEAGDVTELTASIKEHPDELNIVGVSKKFGRRVCVYL